MCLTNLKVRPTQVLVIPNSQDATSQIACKGTTIKAKAQHRHWAPHQELSSSAIHIEAKLICKRLLLCRRTTIALQMEYYWFGFQMTIRFASERIALRI